MSKYKHNIVKYKNLPRKQGSDDKKNNPTPDHYP